MLILNQFILKPVFLSKKCIFSSGTLKFINWFRSRMLCSHCMWTMSGIFVFANSPWIIVVEPMGSGILTFSLISPFIHFLFVVITFSLLIITRMAFDSDFESNLIRNFPNQFTYVIISNRIEYNGWINHICH